MRSLSTLRSAWLTLTLLPGLLLVIAAVLVDGRQRDAARLDRLASDARIAAEAIDLRLGKLLELTAFCASSASLLEQCRFRRLYARIADAMRSYSVPGPWSRSSARSIARS
jgi:hypothetical protein